MAATVRIETLDQLVREVRKGGSPPRVVIARSAEAFVLRAGVEAHEKGVAEPILVGDMPATEEVARREGLDISGFRKEHFTDDTEAVTEAVRMFRDNEADLIMKGLVSTSILLKAVLNKETGVPPKTGILSHVSVFESPTDGRLTVLTDAGVNIKPSMQRKADILRNAIEVARKLGFSKPRCAMLAATEKVNYPAMPATLDADVIAKMSDKGEFGDAIVAGPLSLDLALSSTAASCKRVGGPVAGCAEVLVTPDIESGNILYKSLTTLSKVHIASVVIGSDVPVVVPSRGDSDRSKFYSIALAAYLSRSNGR